MSFTRYNKKEIVELKRIAKLPTIEKAGAVSSLSKSSGRTEAGIIAALYTHGKMRKVRTYNGRNNSNVTTTVVGELRLPIKSICIDGGMLIIKYTK